MFAQRLAQVSASATLKVAAEAERLRRAGVRDLTNERIFSVIMSTSNHRPFTFRPGVPGVPESGGGREAGVRYADHAIGRFMEMLQSRPYVNDTVVVIVADHGARVRNDTPR